MRMPEEICLVFVTCPRDRAEALAGVLVEARHAACVNVVPQIGSVYRWKGEVQRDDEALLLIKTRADRFEALRQAVLKHHPYELPEVIAVKLDAGHAPYLQWVGENVS